MNGILEKARRRFEEFCEDEMNLVMAYSFISVVGTAFAYYKLGYDKCGKDMIKVLRKNPGQDLLFWNRGKIASVKVNK